jgi:hypothetical protein
MMTAGIEHGDIRRPVVKRGDEAAQDRRHERGHVPADDEAAIGVGRCETQRDGGERTLERPDVVDEADLGVDRRHIADPDDNDDLVADEPDGIDGMVEERPAVDRFAQLVAAEPGRPTTG